MQNFFARTWVTLIGQEYFALPNSETIFLLVEVQVEDDIPNL